MTKINSLKQLQLSLKKKGKAIISAIPPFDIYRTV